MGVLSASFTIATLNHVTSFSQSTIFYTSYILTAMTTVYPLLSKLFGANPLPELIEFLTINDSRVSELHEH